MSNIQQLAKTRNLPQVTVVNNVTNWTKKRCIKLNEVKSRLKSISPTKYVYILIVVVNKQMIPPHANEAKYVGVNLKA